MFILGLNAFHGDASACLIKDGELVSAVEEERFRRIKHWAGFPSMSLKWCLNDAKIDISDIDYIAINQDPRANMFKKLLFAIKERPSFEMLYDRFQNKRKRTGVKELIEKAFPQSLFSGKIINVEHHEAHLSSAFHVSPFDKAVILSIDGFGDFSSTAWGLGKGHQLSIKDRIYFPHSMGIFYQAMTQFLGFNQYGDEYKVMGLAPYGKAKYFETLKNVVYTDSDGRFSLNLEFFRHDKEKIAFEWADGAPSFGKLFTKRLENLLGSPRSVGDPIKQFHKDLAHSVQMMYESVLFNLLNKLHEKYKIKSLALAGGCAMNSVANGKIALNTPFNEVYVQSAAGDAGGAIGAAMKTWYDVANNSDIKKSSFHDHAYWGPSYSDIEIEKILKTHSDHLNRKKFDLVYMEKFSEIAHITAVEISHGKVVGWFQGRMEWGPRALGNRSIICDPRKADMKDTLNRKIKRRESFRPFAPSILREKVSEWFEQDADVPFMMQVFNVRKKKRKLIPAVTHVDGSGRLQTVTAHSNLRYYKLIEEFYKLTKVPIILNTSFNENEPVVCSPSEALETFLRTKMDLLVIGNWIIKRKF